VHAIVRRAVITSAIVALGYALVTDIPAHAGPPRIYSEDGKYLGDADANPYNKNSVNNPYGKYGSPYEKDSIRNPQGRYGSPMSRDSVNNPYESGRYGNRNRNRGGDGE
jgi:hypothetical protein